MSAGEGYVEGIAELTEQLEGYTPALERNLQKAMDFFGTEFASYVREQKLSGQVLRNVTGELRGSIKHAPFSTDTEIGVAIGVALGPSEVYGWAHEVGVDKMVQVRAHTRLGRPVRSHPRHQYAKARHYLGGSLPERRARFLEVITAATEAARPGA